MTTKKQPIQSDAEATKAATPQKTAAEHRKLQREKDNLVYETTKVIVPLWFGKASVPIRKLVDGPQMRPEEALCLLIHGANIGVEGYSSVVSCELALRPSGFNRFEANYIAYMGTVSLLRAKLVKFVKKPKDGVDEETAPIVLTTKGEQLFDFAKGHILKPAPWSKANNKVDA
jgi:hypothetical protein